MKVCVFTHKHVCGARMVVAHCLIGGPNSLGRQGGERGGNLAPYDDIWGRSRNLALMFQRRSRIAGARFIPNAISSYWETIGRLGELILMLENLIE